MPRPVDSLESYRNLQIAEEQNKYNQGKVDKTQERHDRLQQEKIDRERNQYNTRN